MLGLLLPLMATQATAQSTKLVADVPFDFTVCHEQMPAGKYHVRPITSANPNVLIVHSEDNRSIEIVCTQDVQSQTAAPSGKLIFNRYGDQYFLSQMWLPGRKTGTQLAKSQKEEALQREMKVVKKAEKVTVTITEVKP